MRRPSFNSSTLMIAIFVNSFGKSPGFSQNRVKALAPGTLNLSHTLVGLPRILPYCYRPVVVASMYAHEISPDPLGQGDPKGRSGRKDRAEFGNDRSSQIASAAAVSAIAH
jgi:hypothetical protein